MPVKFHIQIQAPPEKVFDTLADVANHPAWSNPKGRDEDDADERRRPRPSGALSLRGHPS